MTAKPRVEAIAAMVALNRAVGDARDLASELFGSFAASEGFAAAVSDVGEVEVLDTDRSAPRRDSRVEQLADSGS